MGYNETIIGYGETTVAMESRTVNVSCGLGFSSEVRGRNLKSTPFCPQSSSKLTQPIIKDRKVYNYKSYTGSVSSGLGFGSDVRGRGSKISPFWPRYISKLTLPIITNDLMCHYKNILSAKAAVDNAVPKSFVYYIKNQDRVKQNQMRSRPHSATLLSQRSRRASCYSAQSRSVCDDDCPNVCMRNSFVSSPRFATTFHSNESVYPEVALQRRPSAGPLRALEDQNMYKAFQEPEQMTYNGDLLQKHSYLFTADKPFTPKTLKSEKSSYLSKYRYYRAPPTRTPLDYNNTQQEANYGRAKSKQGTQVLDESSQLLSGDLDLTTDHEGSEAELSGTVLSSSIQQNWGTTSRDRSFRNDLQRASPDDMKTSKMETRSVPAEEEIEYLKFFSAVTEDILSQGHISDRVISQVFQWHLDNNLNQLDEGKVCRLLEVLRSDFDQPTNNISSGELDQVKDNQLDSHLLHLQPEPEAEADNDLFFYVSQGQYHDPSDYGEPLQVVPPLGSTERITSPEIFQREHKEDIISGGSAPPSLNKPVTDTTGTSDDTIDCFNDEKHEDTNVTLLVEDQADTHSDEQPKEVEELTSTLSQSLHVSRDTDGEHVDTATALEKTNDVSSVSDDEF